MNRKQRRAAQRKQPKAATDKMAEQITQFEQLPDECLACTKPFDKKDKDMAMTWNVVIRDEKTVRLYCPDCWSMARRVAEEYRREKEEK